MEQLLTATIVLVVAFAGLPVLPRNHSVVKAVWTAASFTAFTFALARCIGSPIIPHFEGLAGWHVTWAEILEAFWWLTGARLLVAMVYVWAGADRKLGNSRLATDIIAGAVYVFAALAITNDVLQIPIRGLLATSGVIAIVLGLALQSTLSDVFSGISINIERPFDTGEVIQIDGAVEGTVTQINWRATHVLTGVDDIAIIPNSVVAKARIINRSRPAPRRGASLVLNLDARTTPETGIRVLRDAAMTAAMPLREPAPSVQCNLIRATGVEYEVFFHVHTDMDLADARTEVIRHVHCALAWAGIPVARTEGPLPDLPDALDNAATAVRKMRLIGLFEALSAAEIGTLAGKLTKRSLAAGEVVVAQGAQGGGLFIIESGVVEATRDQGTRSATLVGRLGAGEHFGEVSLLTGEVFGATATALTPLDLYILNAADLAPMLHSRPALAAEFGAIVERQRLAYAQHPATAFHAPQGATQSDALLRRIEQFFRAAPVSLS